MKYDANKHRHVLGLLEYRSKAPTQHHNHHHHFIFNNVYIEYSVASTLYLSHCLLPITLLIDVAFEITISISVHLYELVNYSLKL